MPPAARITDSTSHPGIIAGPGAPTVLVSGMPAAVVSDTHICLLPPNAGPHPPAPFAKGSSTVLIAGGLSKGQELGPGVLALSKDDIFAGADAPNGLERI